MLWVRERILSLFVLKWLYLYLLQNASGNVQWLISAFTEVILWLTLQKLKILIISSISTLHKPPQNLSDSKFVLLRPSASTSTSTRRIFSIFLHGWGENQRFSYTVGGKLERFICFSFIRHRASPLQLSGFKIRAVQDLNIWQHLSERFRFSHISRVELHKMNFVCPPHRISLTIYRIHSSCR